MKLLVTGGAGYVGAPITEALVASGHDVSVFDDLPAHSRHVPREAGRLIEATLHDADAIAAALREVAPDVVVHCADPVPVSSSLREPGRYYQAVLDGGVNLLEAMVASGCERIVYLSNAAVYGHPEKMPVDERTAPKPITPAGHALLVFEQILDWYQKSHAISATSLRVFNAAGATATCGEWASSSTRLMSRILKVVFGAEAFVPLHGDSHATPDGTCIRDYVHIADIASAVVAAVNSEKRGVYNVGSGEGYSVGQVIDCARRTTGHEVPVRVMPPRPGDPPRLVAACHRARIDWTWRPQFTKISDIFGSAWQWAQEHPQIYRNPT